MKPDKAMRVIEKSRTKLAAAVRSARSDIARVKANGDLTEKAKSPAIRARREELCEAVDEIESAAQEALTKLGETGPKASRIDAAEATRAWARIKQRLEAGEPAGTVAQDLARRGDRLAVKVLVEEVPDYLRASGLEQRAVQREMVPVLSAEDPILSDDEREHRDLMGDASKAVGLVRTNAGLVRADLETCEQIFGATPEETIHLED